MGLLRLFFILMFSMPLLQSCLKKGEISVSINGKSTVVSPTSNLSLTLSPIEVFEGDSVVVAFILSDSAPQDLDIEWRVSGADAASDFPALSGTATILKDQQSAFSTISTTENSVYDLNRNYNFSIKVLNASSEWTTVNFQVKDDESTPVVEFANATQNINEGALSPVSNVTITPASKFPITVNYAVTGSASTSLDHLVSDGSFIIPAQSISYQFPLTVVDDSVVEASETIILNLSSITGAATIGTTATQTNTIIDNETVNISINDVAALEGDSLTFTVALSAVAGSPVSVNWTTANGSGSAGSDFTGASGTVTITPPATSATVVINSVEDSNVCEVAKNFNVNLSSPVGAAIADATGVGSINDEDSPTVAFSSTTSSAAEGNSGTGSANVALSLSSVCPTHDVTVQVQSSNGTALAGSDYTAIPLTSFTIVQNTSSVNVPVTIQGDVIYENDETLSLALTNPGGSSLGTNTSHTLTITNDDAKPTLSIADVNYTELSSGGSANATFTVTLSGVSSFNTTFDYATSDGTATSADYSSVSGTGTITAGSTSTTITVPVVRDNLDENDETVTMTLSGGNGNYAVPGSDFTGLLTILDDDATPSISIANAAAVTEGGSSSFTVTLSAVSGRDVSFDFVTSNGGALAGSDYTAKSTSVTIAAGSLSSAVTVNSIDDSAPCEQPETFTATISNFVNASAGSPVSATGTINDNENVQPELSVAGVTVTEGQTANMTLTATFSCGSPITVKYATQENLAIPSHDYIAESGTLTIPANQTSVNFDIVTSDDSYIESTETFFIRLSNPSIGTLVPAGAVVTVDDNEGGVGVARVRLADESACAVSTSGEVKCWGRTKNIGRTLYGNPNVGDDVSELGDNLVSVNLGAGFTPLKLTIGSYHTCALVRDSNDSNKQKVKCWGENSDGRLGLGHTMSMGDSAQELGLSLPTVNLGTSRTAVDVCTGSKHTCILLDNGEVKCYGGQERGNLGIPIGINSQGNTPTNTGDNAQNVTFGPGRGATSLSCGTVHNCVILDDNSVQCWGEGYYGRLGNGETGSNSYKTSPVTVLLGSTVTPLKISSTGAFNCALLLDSSDGKKKIKCWGSNGSGQLGYGDNNDRGDVPNEMNDFLPFVSFNTAVGVEPIDLWTNNRASCAKFSDGSYKCWGAANYNGTTAQRGDGATDMLTLPDVNFGAGLSIEAFSPWGDGACAILNDGSNKSFRCFGVTTNSVNWVGATASTSFSIPLGTGMTPILGAPGNGGRHMCAIVNDGSSDLVRCWGENGSGQVGNGRGVIGDQLSEVGSNLPPVDLGVGLTAQDVAVGSLYTCVLFTNGSIKCVGDGSSNRLGTGNNNHWGDGALETLANATPVNLGGKKAISITGGINSACALLEDFTMNCWGESLSVMDLGTGNYPVALASGYDRRAAILNDGSVKFWGDNVTGAAGISGSSYIGDVVSERGDLLLPLNFGLDSFSNPYMVSQISSSYNYSHSCSVYTNGDVKCWGSGSNGKLGINSTSNTLAATTTKVNLGNLATKVSAGPHYSCAVLINGDLKCWGLNANGQLGYGDTITRGDNNTTRSMALVQPISLGTGHKAIDVETNMGYACALLDNAKIKCWGNAGSAETGYGDLVQRGHTPGTTPDTYSEVDLGW